MKYDKALMDVQGGLVSEDTLDALKYRDLKRPFRGGTITSDDPIKEKEFIDFMNSEWAVVRSGSSDNIMGGVTDAGPDKLHFHLANLDESHFPQPGHHSASGFLPAERFGVRANRIIQDRH